MSLGVRIKVEQKCTTLNDTQNIPAQTISKQKQKGIKYFEDAYTINELHLPLRYLRIPNQEIQARCLVECTGKLLIFSGHKRAVITESVIRMTDWWHWKVRMVPLHRVVYRCVERILRNVHGVDAQIWLENDHHENEEGCQFDEFGLTGGFVLIFIFISFALKMVILRGRSIDPSASINLHFLYLLE